MDNPSKIRVTYRASGNVSYSSSGGTETIELSVEIDNIEDYSATYDLLQSLALEKLNLNKQHDELRSKYQDTREQYLKLVKQLESASQQWELVQNFLKAQGLKTDAAEFPQEALTNLSKSVPAISSGYPE